MKSAEVFKVIRTDLQELCTEKEWRYIEPLVETDIDFSTFPLITMENRATPSEHAERGVHDMVDIILLYALRGRGTEIIDGLSDMEKEIKDKLRENRTLDQHTRFFDVSVANRDYTTGSGVVVAWGEMSVTCTVVDDEIY